MPTLCPRGTVRGLSGEGALIAGLSLHCSRPASFLPVHAFACTAEWAFGQRARRLCKSHRPA